VPRTGTKGLCGAAGQFSGYIPLPQVQSCLHRCWKSGSGRISDYDEDAPREGSDFNRRLSFSDLTHVPLSVPLDVREDLVQATSDDILVRGPGKIEIDGSVVPIPVCDWPALQLTLTLCEALGDSKVVLEAMFSKENGVLWKLNR